MAKLVIFDGYEWSVEGSPGFERYTQLRKVEEKVEIMEEDKPKHKKKKKEEVD